MEIKVKLEQEINDKLSNLQKRIAEIDNNMQTLKMDITNLPQVQPIMKKMDKLFQEKGDIAREAQVLQVELQALRTAVDLIIDEDLDKDAAYNKIKLQAADNQKFFEKQQKDGLDKIKSYVQKLLVAKEAAKKTKKAKPNLKANKKSN